MSMRMRMTAITSVVGDSPESLQRRTVEYAPKLAAAARQGSGAVASLLGCPGGCTIALAAALSHLRRPLDAIDWMEGGAR